MTHTGNRGCGSDTHRKEGVGPVVRGGVASIGATFS